MTIAYSYIRFSTPIQKLGRSHDRQMELCEEWCAREGVTLSDDRFFDDGRSGYTGEHLGEKGQLRRFKALVDDGTIKSGSYLIVESLDRLSRQNVWQALPEFMGLIQKGIKIVTLMDRKVYTSEGDAQDLILSIFVMSRAHEESQTKAVRAADDWRSKVAKARESGRPVGKAVAKWLDLVERKDGRGKEYVLNPERAAVVRRVFQMCIDGRGFVAMAQALNNDNVKAFKGGTWCSSSVDDLLKNRCVLGEWEPKDGKGVIEGYFPAVIDGDTWARAQVSMEQRRSWKATKQTGNFQVWQGIAKCGLCGASMNVLTKPKAKTQRKGQTQVAPYKYLACSNKRKGLCQAINLSLSETEIVFKELLVKVGALSLIQSDSADAARQLDVIDGHLIRQGQLLRQHLAAADRFTESDAIYGLIAKTEGEIARLNAEKTAVELKLAEDAISQGDKAWLLENLPLSEYAERHRANSLLKRLGVQVRVTGGTSPVYVASRSAEVNVPILPLIDGEEMKFKIEKGSKDFLQLVSTKEGIVLVPMTADQREAFAQQDADGTDLAKVDKWLASLGMHPRRSRTTSDVDE